VSVHRRGSPEYLGKRATALLHNDTYARKRGILAATEPVEKHDTGPRMEAGGATVKRPSHRRE
jgi:hypothetical protein